MKRPFCHLNIPYKVKDTWKSSITDFNSKQYFRIDTHDVLEEETLQFLSNIGIEAAYKPNIWSWLKLKPDSWHTDQRQDTDQIVAINYLLQGSPGFTEWIDKSKVGSPVLDGDSIYGTRDIRYITNLPPDFRESVKRGYPMLMNTSVPHRVDRTDQKSIDDVRWMIRIFIKRINSNDVLTWDEALKIFEPYKLNDR